MNNVIADTHMDGDRNVMTKGSGKHAQIFVWIVTFGHKLTHAFAQAKFFFCPTVNNLIKLTGLLPKPELTGCRVARHTLSRLPNPSKLVLMDRACAIHCYMRDQTPLD